MTNAADETGRMIGAAAAAATSVNRQHHVAQKRRRKIRWMIVMLLIPILALLVYRTLEWGSNKKTAPSTPTLSRGVDESFAELRDGVVVIFDKARKAISQNDGKGDAPETKGKEDAKRDGQKEDGRYFPEIVTKSGGVHDRPDGALVLPGARSSGTRVSPFSMSGPREESDPYAGHRESSDVFGLFPDHSSVEVARAAKGNERRASSPGRDGVLAKTYSGDRFDPGKVTRLRHVNRLVAEGRVASCTVMQAFSSVVPIQYTCELNEDIKGHDGAEVLIQRGTSFTAQFKGGVQVGDTRVPVTVLSATTPACPNGRQEADRIVLTAAIVGRMGEGGASGHVDTRIPERLLASFIGLLARGSVSATAQVGGGSQGSGTTVVLPNAATGAANQVISRDAAAIANLPPIITFQPGERQNIMFLSDVVVPRGCMS